MSRKHNAKHPSRGANTRYQQKVQEQGPSRLLEVRLVDGKPSSAARS